MSPADLLGGKEGSEDQHVYGVVVGIVTNNQDPEGLGRVKIAFPWRGVKDESYWARIASPMAGNGRGMVFFPEVDDEVLVAFEQGDLNRPYVVGGLWNGKDKPPETNSDGKNNIRKIRSRSGHEVIFNDDGAGKKEKIEIRTNSGHKIVLDDSAGAEKIEITDKTGSNSILIDSVQNSVAVTSSMKLKIKANVVEIEADSTMTIKAGATLTLQGALVKIN